MKYYSEKLSKLYDSEEELREAEKKADEAKNKEAAMRKERAEAAKLVEEKYKEKVKAENEYLDTLNNFCKRYGTYHKTYTSEDIPRSNAALASSLVDVINSFIYR